MQEITELLGRARNGNDAALKEVFDRVYLDLKRVAAARLGARQPGATLTPTVLVHEAFERLVAAENLELVDRRHFFACVAQSMRHIIVDHARRAAAAKRGGDQIEVTWSEELAGKGDAALELLDLDRALDELSQVSPRARDVVDMRFFAGRTAKETAELLDISLRTANREWERARAFLHTRLQAS